MDDCIASLNAALSSQRCEGGETYLSASSAPFSFNIALLEFSSDVIAICCRSRAF